MKIIMSGEKIAMHDLEDKDRTAGSNQKKNMGGFNSFYKSYPMIGANQRGDGPV